MLHYSHIIGEKTVYLYACLMIAGIIVIRRPALISFDTGCRQDDLQSVGGKM
jgi:hypothetical protein